MSLFNWFVGQSGLSWFSKPSKSITLDTKDDSQPNLGSLPLAKLIGVISTSANKLLETTNNYISTPSIKKNHNQKFYDQIYKKKESIISDVRTTSSIRRTGRSIPFRDRELVRTFDISIEDFMDAIHKYTIDVDGKKKNKTNLDNYASGKGAPPKK